MSATYESLLQEAQIEGLDQKSIESLARRAIALNPSRLEGYSLLGNALTSQDRLNEALEAYEQALKINPLDWEANSCKGVALLSLEKYQEAEEPLCTAITQNPNCAEAYSNLGIQALNSEEKNMEKGLAMFRKALEIDPSNNDYILNLAKVLHQMKRYQECMGVLEKALKEKPDQKDIFTMAVNLLKGLGREEEMINLCNKALGLQPENEYFLLTASAAYYQVDRVSESWEILQKLEKFFPNSEQYLTFGSLVCLRLGKEKEAKILVDRFYEKKPNSYQPLMCLVNYYRTVKDYEKAIKIAKEGCRLHPQKKEVFEFLIADSLLVQEKYKEGWQYYESRFTYSYRSFVHVKMTCPRWMGEPMSENETLAVVGEQGWGDNLQFIRYVESLNTKAKIILMFKEPMHEIILSSKIPGTIAEEGASFKNENMKYTPVASLPMHLGIEPSNAITKEPYLQPGEKKMKFWKERINSYAPIIGINWCASREGKAIGRSIPLKAILEVLKDLNCEILSLQRGPGTEELMKLKQDYANIFTSSQYLADQAINFADIGAIAHCCDTVISIDTSIVHLCGAMNINTFILLPKNAEWRWGCKERDTHWYSSAKLFRQKKEGDWSHPLSEVKTNLALRLGIKH